MVETNVSNSSSDKRLFNKVFHLTGGEFQYHPDYDKPWTENNLIMHYP